MMRDRSLCACRQPPKFEESHRDNTRVSYSPYWLKVIFVMVHTIRLPYGRIKRIKQLVLFRKLTKIFNNMDYTARIHCVQFCVQSVNMCTAESVCFVSNTFRVAQCVLYRRCCSVGVWKMLQQTHISCYIELNLSAASTLPHSCDYYYER